MKRIKMLNLLEKILKYDFFDWELEEENKNFISIGMPKNILNKLHFPEFYNSMGFDAVNNPYAKPSLNPSEWLRIEEEFFNWFKEAENILFGKKELIVTPYIERNWWLYENKDHSWILPEYEEYMALLEKCEILEAAPSLNEPSRGGEIETFNELIILAKMSIKGVPLLFLNEDTVFKITDYLTVEIFFRDKEMLDKEKNQLIKQLNAQILAE